MERSFANTTANAWMSDRSMLDASRAMSELARRPDELSTEVPP